MVVLEEKVAADSFSKARYTFEFAGGYSRFHGVAAAIIFEDLYVVEPMLDVVALYDNPGPVDFAHWFCGRCYGWLKHVVKGSGDVRSAGDLSIRVELVIEHLIFMSESGIA